MTTDFLQFGLSFSIAMILPMTILVGCVKRSALNGTTLEPVWTWSAVAVLGWCMAWFEYIWAEDPSGYRDQLWYGVAVLSLCPLMAVLGARRPVARVWNVFVVLPLILVLEWPAWANWSDQPGRIELTPTTVLGFGLVLLMGVGNYFGTRFLLGFLLQAIALGLLLWTIEPDSFDTRIGLGENRWKIRGAATVCFCWGWIRVGRRIDPSEAWAPGLNRVWRDFRDLFGIVWARRIMERLNQLARNEKRTLQLDLDGFADHSGPEEDFQRAEEMLRWFLRRFVDEEWIDRRIGHSTDFSVSGTSRSHQTTRK